MSTSGRVPKSGGERRSKKGSCHKLDGLNIRGRSIVQFLRPHRRGLAVLSSTSRAALLYKANTMLAAGRSFPAATTVRRASARTAATGRAWRATPASSPNNNVRGLSSEGTPGTVAGARAAGALRVDAPVPWERQPHSWERTVVVFPLVCYSCLARVCVDKMHTSAVLLCVRCACVLRISRVCDDV